MPNIYTKGLSLSDVVDTSAWVATVSRDWQGSRKLQAHQYQALLALARRLIPAWEGHNNVQGVVPPLPVDQGLQFTPISAALAAQRRADRRQPKEVWQAFRRLALPPQDLDFIHTCLWKKLSVGTVSDRCPFDSSLEDVYHCTKACSWLTIPVRALQSTFPPVWGSGGRVPFGRLCSDYPQLSLTRAPRILIWKAVRVLWSCRCEVVFHKARLTVNDYLWV